jgi:hypothetical protein
MACRKVDRTWASASCPHNAICTGLTKGLTTEQRNICRILYEGRGMITDKKAFELLSAAICVRKPDAVKNFYIEMHAATQEKQVRRA